MKRTLFYLCFLLLTSTAFGQTSTDSLQNFTQVIEVAGQTKSQIYGNILKWIAVNYKSAQDVVQLKDMESGNIVVKGIHSVPTAVLLGQVLSKDTRCILSFAIKDNKTKVTINYVATINPGYPDYPIVKSLTHKMARKKDKRVLTKGLKDDSNLTFQSISTSLLVKDDDW